MSIAAFTATECAFPLLMVLALRQMWRARDGGDLWRWAFAIALDFASGCGFGGVLSHRRDVVEAAWIMLAALLVLHTYVAMVRLARRWWPAAAMRRTLIFLVFSSPLSFWFGWACGEIGFWGPPERAKHDPQATATYAAAAWNAGVRNRVQRYTSGIRAGAGVPPPVEEVSAPIIGWREYGVAWDVRLGLLLSGMRTVWYAVHFDAVCAHGDPVEQCVASGPCGVYGMRLPGEVEGIGPAIMARCRFEGTVLIAERGCKATACTIEALYVVADEDLSVTVDALAARYAVPVQGLTRAEWDRLCKLYEQTHGG